MNQANPLVDVVPEIWRKRIYAALFLLAIVFSAYQLSDGNWLEFAAGLVTSLLGLMAASNTAVKE